MAVSGEFKYLGPAFSSVARVRPVKAMILPASLAMGNMTRLRNLEYIAASGLRVTACGGGEKSESPPCPSKGRTDKDGAPPVCFHENKPLSRNTSSPNSAIRRSRRRKPESGA